MNLNEQRIKQFYQIIKEKLPMNNEEEEEEEEEEEVSKQ